MAVTYEQVRDWVLALPGCSEVMVESWGHPTLRVGDKMFAAGAVDSPTMSVKASKDDQTELIAGDPATYSMAAYVGRFGWVQVQLATADPDELRQIVVEAWRRTAPKRTVKAYDTAQGDTAQGDTAQGDSAQG
jgi:hypothetical protein